MEKTPDPVASVRGRPRNFDRREALEKAVEVFWRKGYEMASLSDLTAAMGINPPSLYAAFGDKESLYLEALEAYVTGVASRDAVIEGAPTARAAIEALLERSVTALPKLGMGCMLVTSAVNASSEKVRKAMMARRAREEANLKKRIQRGIVEGDVPAGANAGELAKFYETVLQGISMQITDGVPPKVLRTIIANAMLAWPEKKKAPRRRPV